MSRSINSNLNKQSPMQQVDTRESPVVVIPISHASAVLQWGDSAVYTDPVGNADAYGIIAEDPALMLLTDVHSDHLSVDTIVALQKPNTVIVAPQAVADQLPPSIHDVVVLANGQKKDVAGFTVEAVPMYNVPESVNTFHTKGRGNGYVIEKNGYRVYVSGDTGNTPEMRALTHIDLALLCMNLPYTMSVDDAAQAVLAFKPKRVIPYHYRGQDGLADIARFKQLVEEGDRSINVELMDWYTSR